MRKDVITYEVDDNLYINLTNRCCNDCTFCVRNHSDGIADYFLWLEHEPTVDEILGELGYAEKYKEVVFCGFGEPTYRLEEIIQVAKFLRSKGVRTRINTNGLGNLIHGRDISKELSESVDTISISLNATSALAYDELCKSVYGLDALPAIINFAKSCVAAGGDVVMSVVDTIGDEEIEKSRKITDEIGARFRIRTYIP